MDCASLPAHMRQRCLHYALTLAVLGGLCTETWAQSKPPSAPASAAVMDPLVAVADADPLELARVARRLGDVAVLQRLDAKQSLEVRLAAVRATPWLRAPEAALPLLAPMIGQRDTLLAQDAARSLLAIVRELDADALQRREVLRSDLSATVTLLDKVLAIEHLRADLRAMLSTSLALLNTLIASLPG